MKYVLKLNVRDLSDEDLIRDLRKVAKELNQESVTMGQYDQNGQFNSCTFQRRFKSWFKALDLAGLHQNQTPKNVSETLLFHNIQSVWEKLNRQPKSLEMKQPLSAYHVATYERRFGSWNKALVKFIEYIEQSDAIELTSDNTMTEIAMGKQPIVRRTNRNISDRMRFRILLRDGFRCLTCGWSTLTSNDRDRELHVDHIIPWSKGGETEDSNLVTKCSKCNLGKGNAFTE